MRIKKPDKNADWTATISTTALSEQTQYKAASTHRQVRPRAFFLPVFSSCFNIF